MTGVNWKAQNKVRNVNELIHQNFGGDSSVHVGIVYLAIGGDAGKSTDRYLLLIPFYNPTIHGYNFNIQHPFIFARGFTGTASAEFYAWMDEMWTTQVSSVDDSNNLLECSPVLLTKFEYVESAEFKLLPWVSSIHPGCMSLNSNLLECWIHGPRDSIIVEKKLLKGIIIDHRQKFMKLLDENGVENMGTFLEGLMTAFNSFSFPTIQLKITSPLIGLVPFPLKDIRMKFGGEISATDRQENVVHIPVAKPIHEVRRISFQRLWNVLYDPTNAKANAKSLYQRVKFHLNA